VSGYPYPNDEFDTDLDDAHALGIHHAPRSAWSRTWPYLVVVLVCAALAVALVTWFTSQSRPGASATPPPAAATTSVPSSTGEPTTGTSGEAGQSDPATDEPAQGGEAGQSDPATDEPETDEPETDEPEPVELDRGAAIRVLNGTRTQGLAGSRVTTLTDAGWTNVTADNLPSGTTRPATSSVWYASAALEDEARQVAADLGLDTVTLVDGLRGDISVVLVG